VRFKAALIAVLAMVMWLPSQPVPAICPPHGAAERRSIRLINRERTWQGDLRADRDLHAVSERHSRAMRALGFVFHTPERKLGSLVTRWRILGENVGRGTTVRSLHRVFMESAPHRKILKDTRFRHVGVGIVRSPNYLWITETFEAYRNPGTPLC
jgi:uncharacterized protein YkwD